MLKHMTIEERLECYLNKDPQIDASAYVAPQATIIGDVTLKKNASVWPGAVLRGDINSIVIGESSNVQDGCVLHLADEYGVHIGDYVTVGHMAMVHACTIEDECLIGMHSTILDGAIIGRRSIIGAGALVLPGTVVPPGSMVLGVPGKVVKALDTAKQESIRYWAEKYVKVAAAHRQCS